MKVHQKKKKGDFFKDWGRHAQVMNDIPVHRFVLISCQVNFKPSFGVL